VNEGLPKMKLIMENWREYLNEDIENPTTWGELSTKITMQIAAEKWPRLGKTLLKFGFKVATSKAKTAMSLIKDLETVLDFVPDELQDKLEKGAEDAAEKLADMARVRGGVIGSFIVDDIMGMDDSLTKELPGFKELNIEDEYEASVDKEKLKQWAKGVIMYASKAPPDEPLPDLNQELEEWFQEQTGAHPDTDQPDIREPE